MAEKHKITLEKFVPEKCINCHRYFKECCGDYKGCKFYDNCFVEATNPDYKQFTDVNNIVRFTEQ